MGKLGIAASQVRLFVTDIDGTLLSSDHKLSERNIRVIRSFIKNHPDVPLILATGKSFPASLEICQAIPELLGTGIFVQCNGGYVLTTRADAHSTPLARPLVGNVPSSLASLRVLHQTMVPPLEAMYFLHHAYVNRVSPVIYSGSDLFSFQAPAETHPNHESLLGITVRYHEPAVLKLGYDDLIERVLTGDIVVNKIVYVATVETLSGIVAALEAIGETAVPEPIQRNPRYRLHLSRYVAAGHPESGPIRLSPLQPVQLVQTTSETIEIIPRGSSKGRALEIICGKDHLDIPLDSVVAMGDAMNDVEMFKTVGFGIAVQNASEPVKAAAALVCEWSNDQDAVASCIEDIFGPHST
ncbi:HAD-like domain-containing protein [Polychytrium aggregatum]|uniref:HAD-like domain-containing protein n=1 Tax=Polychytrium aggregatum TaxID=110093 RepID=UPI0022FF17C4|nr:HAD-like domain-containing protein [Polychytrium aggregatum]KAI9209240.1 HAD-like domain-containing protein [Polychytrium aggregatum]